MNRRAIVVATGLGTVSSVGCGRASMAAALRDGTRRWTEIDRSAGYHRPGGARLAGLTSRVDLSPWLAPKVARRMSLPSRLARVSAQLAYEDAGLEAGSSDDDGARTAVVVSNAYGPIASSEAILLQRATEGPMAVSPMLFTESVSNAPAAQVAIWCGAKSTSLTVTQREAGPLIALTAGAREIALGRADRVLVIAVDEVTPLQHAILDRFRAPARANANGGEVARPFDRYRTGYIAAEGAAAVLLEPGDRACRRLGDRAAGGWTRVRRGASAFDPSAPAHGWGTDVAGLAGSLAEFLDRAERGPRDIDAIVSGASGAVAGDRLEAMVLRSVWSGLPLPPVLVPKAVTGELGCGHLAGLFLAASGAVFGATPGFRTIDPELGVVPHDGRALPPLRCVLAISLAVGGAAAFTILEREPAP